MKQETKLIHYKGSIDESTGAVSVPIYQVSTFRQDAVGRNLGYEYSRGDNSTRNVLEDYLSELAGGEFGYAFSSGMAAISACLMCLKSGDSLVATEGLYGGTYRVLQRVFKDYSITCHYVDTGDLEGVRRGLDQGASAVLVETPSNPTMRITDIAEVGRLAHEYDAMVMADNTFMSPWLQRPLEWGADVVIHSGTKWLGGHSDVIGGLVVTSDKEIASRVRTIQSGMGAVLPPFDSWVLMRGMKTLGVRLEKGQENAQGIASWLAERSEVQEVLYPGMGNLERDEVHERQADGPGGIVSFRVTDDVSAQTLVENVSLWTLAVSLGAVESIITLPAKMTHLPYARADRERGGIGENLIRLSVGIEDAEDLVKDLENACELAALGT